MVFPSTRSLTEARASMSLRDALDRVKGLNSRLSDLTADVDDLKQKDQAHQEMKVNNHSLNHSRSRSPHSSSGEWESQHSGAP